MCTGHVIIQNGCKHHGYSWVSPMSAVELSRRPLHSLINYGMQGTLNDINPTCKRLMITCFRMQLRQCQCNGHFCCDVLCLLLGLSVHLHTQETASRSEDKLRM